MMPAILSSSVLASVLFFIQTTWLRNGILAGVVPDLGLLVIVWVSCKNERNVGPFTGFFSGLVCDMLSAAPVGFFAFLYVVPAYLVSVLNRIVSVDGIFVPFLLGFFATVAKAFCSIVLSAIFGSSVLNSYFLNDVHLWIEAGLNGALAPLVFLLLNMTGSFFIAKSLPSERLGSGKK
jgi:rod shape-determining protein MreD